MKKDVTIILHVDAENLFHVVQNGVEVDQFVWLSDDNSGQRVAPKDFESAVYQTKRVIWQGMPEGNDSEDYRISIDRIQHDSGYEIFGQDPIQGNAGKVMAAVQNSAQLGSLDTYSIYFSIINKGSESGFQDLRVDPKLRVNP